MRPQVWGLPVIFILILFIILFFVVTNSGFFTIKAVDIKTENIDCVTPQDLKNSTHLLGQNFLLINTSEITNTLKTRYICVKDILISRQFPNKVTLHTFGREAAAILISLKSEEATTAAILQKFTESTGSANLDFKEDQGFLVDEEGVVYSLYKRTVNAPKIYIDQNFTLGQKAGVGLISNTLKILKTVKAFGLNVDDTIIYSKRLLLIEGLPKIIFNVDREIDTQLASLQLILNKAKIDEEKIEFIDLRFDKPVKKIAPKKNGER